MSPKKCSLFLLFVFVGSMVLTACAGEEQVVEVTRVAERETVVETVVEPVETATVVEKETVVATETAVETVPVEPTEEPVELPGKATERLTVLAEDTIEMMGLAEGEFITADSLDAKGGVMTFPGATRDMVPLDVDDVLATGVTAQTPFGLLRMVTDVVETDTGVDVVTEQATLEDALEEGELPHTAELSLPPEAAGVFTKAGGLMKVMPAPNQGGFYIELDDFALVDLDGEPGTNDELIASGGIMITPRYTFNVKISDFSVKQIHFSNETTIESDVTVEATFDVINRHPSEVIFEHTFKPYQFLVGPLPVVLIPRVVVTVGLDGDVSVGVSAGVTHEATIEVGVHYKDGGWRTQRGITNELTYNPPEVQRVAEAKAYVQPRLELMLYGVVAPYAQLDGYFKLNVDPSETPWWELYAGVDVEVGVEFRLFKFIKKGYRAKFPLYWDPIGVLYGGQVLLMDRNDCGGTVEVEISDEAEQRMNIQSTDFWSNDEARSAKLDGVREEIVVRVYDSPGGSEDDDWTEIRIKKPTQDYCVSTFEQMYEDDFVSVTYHHHNGLDGKVSRVELDLPDW